MADKSAIEWTDATWNPIRARNKKNAKLGWFCTHVSEGCRNCYAEKWNERLGTGLAYKPGHLDDIEIYLDEKMLTAPLRWKAPRRIFTLSMSDLFADFVTDEWLDRTFAVMSEAKQHSFHVLTKRSARMRSYLADLSALILPIPNVWLGVSVENQETAAERIPDLLATPAAKRFLSCEPLLGPVDLRDLQPTSATQKGDIDALTGRCIWPSAKGFDDSINATSDRTGKIAWVIAGGESGTDARPMHPEWIRALRDQCEAADVPFFFKQWGAFAPYAGATVEFAQGSGSPEVAWPDGTIAWGTAEDHRGLGTVMHRVGKRKAGRLLDDVEHNGYPA